MNEERIWELRCIARDIVDQEIKFLNTFYPGLPEVDVVVAAEEKKAMVEKADGSVPGYTCGEYCHRSFIIIYVGSIVQFTGDDMDKFRTHVMETLAHEHFHHYQFHGDRKKHYIQSVQEDNANNVPYWDRWIEVQAREAAEWYVGRRRPVTLRMA